MQTLLQTMDGGYREVPGSPMRKTSFAGVFTNGGDAGADDATDDRRRGILRGAAHCHDALFDELVLHGIGECLASTAMRSNGLFERVLIGCCTSMPMQSSRRSIADFRK